MPAAHHRGRAHRAAARERHVQRCPRSRSASTPSGIRRPAGGARTSPRRLCRRSCAGSRRLRSAWPCRRRRRTLTLEIDVEPRTSGTSRSRRPAWTRTASCTPARLEPVEPGLARYELRPGRRRAVCSRSRSTGRRWTAPDEVTFEIRSIEADGEALSLEGWEPLTWRGSAGSVEPEGSGVRYEMDSGASDVIGGHRPELRSSPGPGLPRDRLGGRSDLPGDPRRAGDGARTRSQERCSSPR